MANPNKVGLAEALRQRELDEEDRDSSSDLNDEWETGPDSPKKTTMPARRMVRPGEKAGTPPAPPTTRPAVTKPQPTGSTSAEKRPQSELGRACDAYEVDLSATEFNMCKCGFKKSDHVQSAAFRAAPRPVGNIYHPETAAKPVEKKPVVLPTAPPSTPLQTSVEEPESEGPGPCDAFEVDLTKEFGTCKCGFKRTAHSKSALLAAPKKSPGSGFSSVQSAERQVQEEKRREAEEARQKAEEEAKAHQDYIERERKIREQEDAGEAEPAQQEPFAGSSEQSAPDAEAEEGPKACDSYEIDLNAAEFGTCKCGHKKTDHSKSSLFNKPLPKPIHASAPLGVPGAKPAAPARSMNRAPPAFATSAAPKPAAPSAEPEPEPEVESEPQVEPEAETSHEEEPAEEPAPVDDAATEEALEEQPAGEEAAQTTVLDPPELYIASFDFEGQEVEDLSFKTGDVVEVFEILDADWMRGRVQGTEFTGVFPSNYVQKEHAVATTEAAVNDEPEPVTEPEEAAIAEEEAPVVEEAPMEEVVPVEEPAPEDSAEPEPEPEREPEPEPESAFQEEVVPKDVGLEEASFIEEDVNKEAVAEEVPVQEEGPVVDEALPEEVIAAAESELPFTAYARFEFIGESEGDLTFQAGDTVEVIGIVDSQWWRGICNGNEGIFPADFVSRDASEGAAPAEFEANDVQESNEELPTAASLGYVVALYDMEAQGDGDLPFKTDDRIEILEIIDEEWLRGTLDGKEGLVPRNYVSAIQN